MFQAFALDTTKILQTNKPKIIIITYKEFVGTFIKSKKKNIYTLFIN